VQAGQNLDKNATILLSYHEYIKRHIIKKISCRSTDVAVNKMNFDSENRIK
jgi:hypothetical protein